ncbi:MAG: LytTR family DNA-binding domain-containing protein [Bacilli bacterium]
MINFIVVDDIEAFAISVENVITKIMINNTLAYQTYKFNDYNKKFIDFINKPLPNKVYFLDIETKSASGIDIARMIRRNDIDSVIIFITAHEDLGNVVSKEQLLALTFICKFDGFENKVASATKKALEILDKKRVIRFTDYNTVYTIPIKEILYITRDSIERKCLIKTDYTTYKVSKTVTELKELTQGSLVQTHRACLVNKDRIRKINWTTNELTLNNGEVLTLLSEYYKKELV